ncbi:MAG: hypothetical protein JKY96_06030 [Phycisphaerales bacterium]|nr:hypothetical protein [Phycisphaerales bacterium]
MLQSRSNFASIITGLIVLVILATVSIIVGLLIISGSDKRVAAEFWQLLHTDRDAAIEAIVYIEVAYWPPRPASEATMFLPDPEIYRMDDPNIFARIFPLPLGKSDKFTGTIGTIELRIHTKSDTVAKIFISDSDHWSRMSPAYNPLVGKTLRDDVATTILDWIAHQ